MEIGLVLPAGELRARGGRISGFFSYGKTATVRDRGRVRKERISSRAFAYAVEEPDREVHLLAGHEYGKPLASKQAGTLKLTDTDRALEFEATLPPESSRPSWVRDTVHAVESGLATGISPRFRVPPRDVVPDAERLVPEPGNPGVMIREVNEALLLELSIVTRPVYPATSAEVRAMMAEAEAEDRRRLRTWWFL